MTSSAEPIIGRDAELREISALLDALDREGRGLVLQVAGMPGIGKSRLLAELCAGARDRGHLVFEGRAADFEGELPFGMFADALHDWLAAQPQQRLAELSGGLAGQLAVVLPAFDVPAQTRPPEVPEERFRAYRAVRVLLSALAAEAPVVLVLDDVQWADPGAAELLSHLLAHPPQGAVLVALGFRPAQVSPTLRAALASAVRHHGSRRLDLAPLSVESARELLGADTSITLRDRLYVQSGGNPFFLLQLARGATLAEDEPAFDDDGAASVPEPVRAALLSELSALSAPALGLLQGAAVAGDPFDGRLAAEAADLPEAAALDVVDELLRFELVFETDVPGRFAFRHPIVRAVVYGIAGQGWRSAAHARVVAALSSRGAGPAALAPHIERSAGLGDAEAVAALVAAGEQSAPRAPALAARWYAAALRVLPETPAAKPRRIELQIAMATALGGSGRFESSLRVLAGVLDALPEHDAGRASVVAHCAGIEHHLGRHRAARERLTQAYAVADRRSTASLELELELAAGGDYEHRIDEMLRWSRLALTHATELGERLPALVAAGQIALAHFLGGRSAGELTDRAAAAMDAIDDTELASRLDCGNWIGWTETVLERYEQAVEHCQRLIDIARATGQGAFLLYPLPAQAQALMFMGRLDEAEERLGEVLDAGRLAPHAHLAVAIGISSFIATHRGRFDDAVRAGEESVDLASTTDAGQIKAISGLYLAAPLIEMRAAERARAALLETGGGTADLPDIPRSGRAHALEILTRAELMLGDVDAAEHCARTAVEATNGGELAIESAFAQRAIGAVALARGDATLAATVALDAAARASRAGGPVQAARCRTLAARGLAQAGRRAAAIAQLEHAVRELGRVGADGYRREPAALLRGLGRRVPHPPRDAAGARATLRSLPESARELASLVHLGRTNREIAATIFVSEKTVERRLSRIFAQLGVPNRAALASLVSADDADGTTISSATP